MTEELVDLHKNLLDSLFHPLFFPLRINNPQTTQTSFKINNEVNYES